MINAKCKYYQKLKSSRHCRCKKDGSLRKKPCRCPNFKESQIREFLRSIF